MNMTVLPVEARREWISSFKLQGQYISGGVCVRSGRKTIIKCAINNVLSEPRDHGQTVYSSRLWRTMRVPWDTKPCLTAVVGFAVNGIYNAHLRLRLG